MTVLPAVPLNTHFSTSNFTNFLVLHLFCFPYQSPFPLFPSQMECFVLNETVFCFLVRKRTSLNSIQSQPLFSGLAAKQKQTC